MKIFEKRPLCMILCIMLAGFSLFSKYEGNASLWVAIASPLLIIPIFAFRNLFKGRITITIVAIGCFSLSVLLAFIFSSTFYPTDFYNERINCEALVVESDHTDGSHSELVIETSNVENKKHSYKFVVFGSKEHLSGINTGDVIHICATLSKFDTNSESEINTYYQSRGITGKLTSISSCDIIDREEMPIRNFLNKARRYTANKFLTYTDHSTGSLLTALIIGDRSYLSSNTLSSFKRIGITHILALSGMHLAILSVGLSYLLSLLKVNKKIKMLVLPIFVLLYMAFTGFSVSVTRAGFMLLFTSVLFVLRRPRDHFTNLTASVFLIVLFTPYSCFDLSLWLSAFATIGILVFSHNYNNYEELPLFKRIVRFVRNLLLSSIFAITSSMFITGLSFEAISLIAPLTTAIFSILIEILIYGGLILLLTFNIIPYGGFLCILTKIINGLADYFSTSKWIHLPTDGAATKFLIIILTVLFFSFLLFDVKKKSIAVISLCIFYVLINASALIDLYTNVSDEKTILTSNNAEDVIFISSEKEATLIYYGKGYESSVERILEFLTDNEITYLDNLVFINHFYDMHVTAENIISGVKTERIYIPSPISSKEKKVCLDIADMLKSYGSTLDLYQIESRLTFGSAEFSLLQRMDYSTDNDRNANVFKLKLNNLNYAYMSKGSVADFPHRIPNGLDDVDVLIFGGVGSFPEGAHYFDLYLNEIDSFIFCSDQWFTDEAYDYYNKRNVERITYKKPIYLYD